MIVEIFLVLLNIFFTQSDDGGQEADEGEQEAAGGERGHVELGGGLLCNIGMEIIFCPSLSQSGM